MEEYRLDVYLHNKGFVDSREKAKHLIINSCVYVNDKIKTKASFKVTNDDIIKVTNDLCYVGRGASKLEKAVMLFNIDIDNMVAVDIGASTGGFTDYLIRHGAKKVYAVDVGHGQLHDTLKKNERVINIENTNFRYADALIFTDDVDIIVADVSFISLKYILPKIVEISHENTNIVVLVKPQFEAGKNNVGKNGIVKNKGVHFDVLNNFNEYCHKNNLTIVNLTYSPIQGGDGNIEYLAHLRKNIKDENVLNFKDLIKEAFEVL
ncbi:MAG: TlyA family RNA methyltransferase [Sedimentibacter sp.]|uniref:TlyA family RNA methyltransferase n=1 Tax=Sedimentibacter sp. TaxID=1960295 RepID=UPI002981BCA0|nr:TlyA family RNA methyltransferase [Sedimentibacter sp.]MDW5300319.1 TlyA family RNA methyltransferase [Sedimentibacter sp.]